MLVWATEFPTGAGNSVEDLLALAVEWLDGSPHHPWFDTDIDWAVPEGTTVYEKDGQVVEVSRAETDNERWGGLRHTYVESGKEREWVAAIVGHENGDGLRVSVRIQCNLLAAGLELPDPKKPYIIRQIIERLGGGRDGGLPIGDEPIHLAEDEVDRAANYIVGKTENDLPVVYVSAGWDGVPAVDPAELSEWLSGMAHVLVEPSRSFSISLAGKVNRANAYGGAVGVYWPRGVAPHDRFLKRDYGSPHEMQQAIASEVRSALTQIQPTSGCTWSHLLDMASRARIEKLREETDSEDVEEYAKVFDAQIEAKNEKIEELESERYRLRSKLQALDAARGGATQGGLLEPGEEQEYYPGELKDAVLQALEIARKGLHDDSRRQHLVDDLLEANTTTGYEDEFTQQLKGSLSTMSDFGGDERRALRDLGFTLEEDRRHVRALFQGDERYAVTIPKTASDHRTGKNLVSSVRNLLFS